MGYCHGLLVSSWVIYLGTYMKYVNLIPLNPGFKPAQPGIHLVAHHLVAKLLMMKWTSGMPRLIGVNREEQSTESWFGDFRF